MLVLDFVNTLDLRPYAEGLDSPEALRAWMLERGLVGNECRATATDLAEAIKLREALRSLMAAHNELPVDVAGASAVVDTIAREAGLSVRFSDGGVRLESSADGPSGAFGAILGEVAAAMADGTWERMKACRADDCRWVFLDTAKNHSRAWCSMSSCGNREKVRVYRARHGLS